MSASKILLILGAGGNVGSNVASLFGKSGYQVALAARRLTDGKGEEGHLHIKADLSNPASVEKVFERVTSTFGPPNVVVYNAAAATFVPKDDPLNLSVEALNKDLAVTTISALAAAKQAVKAFDDLPADSTKVFIYTGNFLNKTALPAVLSLGMGKSASAHLMEVAAKAYGSKGYCFYYADERGSNGDAVFAKISGSNHAQHYLELAQSKEQKPWLQTFVGGQGYRDFA